MRRLIAVCALVACTVVISGTKSTAATPARPSDFNGDGIADLVIGAPFEDVDAFGSAGAIHVLYGYSNGLRSLGDQYFTQASPGVPGDLQAVANFGDAIAAGDFNGDGFSDLAVGAPNEDVGSVTGPEA